MKPICEVTHRQILEGTCPWCDTELSGEGSPSGNASGRSKKCQWNVAALNAGLEDDSTEVRSSTVTNLMFKHGPPLQVAIPLLAKATVDDTEAVSRLAENALSSLGRDINLAEAQILEVDLQGTSYELATRILLLGYYFIGQRLSPAARESRHKHVVWIIQNAPESATAGSPNALVLEREDGECYSEARRLWIEQVQIHSNNPSVLGNAANFFVLNDKTLSEEYFKRAQALEPQNPTWRERLGHLYSLLSRGEVTESAKYAKLAYQELEASEEVRLNSAGDSNVDNSENGEDDVDASILTRMHSLPNLARAALAASEFEEACQYASALLTLARSEDVPEFFRNDGNAIHYGNLVLGQCELRNGNFDAAKKYLLASGKTTGSPNLGSFGPNMSLAKELLEIGEREVVLDYFDLCKVFWKSGIDELQQWAEQVKRGEIPDFGANLDY